MIGFGPSKDLYKVYIGFHGGFRVQILVGLFCRRH